MAFKDVIIIIAIILSLGLGVFNFLITGTTVGDIYHNLENSNVNFDQIYNKFNSVDEFANSIYEENGVLYKKLNEINDITNSRVDNLTKVLAVLSIYSAKNAKDIKDIRKEIDELGKNVQKNSLENEHLWLHYKETRERQNDIFGILEKTQRDLEEHYHGPKPLLY